MLYDFANSPFTTLVVTFVYATYFTQAIAPDPLRGTVLWSRGVTLSALVVAAASPLLGALADRGGYRRAFLLLFTALCAAATAALYPILPGQVVAALACFVVANVAFELACVFYNAFLPDLAAPQRVGRVSGYGWAAGYAGGLVALVVALVALVRPEQPWLGFSTELGENVRATNLLVAAWLVVFALPIALWVRESPRRDVAPIGRPLADALRQLGSTFVEVRRHGQIARLLAARLLYNDGVITIFAFGGIYAAESFGFTMQEVLVFGIVLNVAAGLGALGFGFLDDRLGGKRTIEISLAGLTAASLLAVFAPSRPWLWVAGIAIGICVGPNQSASRSLLARFVPRGQYNQFYGFFAFSGKLTAFVGPWLLGVLTGATGSQRAGLAVVVVLLAAGWLLLRSVDEQRGIRAAAPLGPGPAAVRPD